jgi:hypothetical protein
MSTKDKYYHFPLCLLSNLPELHDQGSFYETLDLIAAWAYGNAGRDFIQDKREEAGGGFLVEKARESRSDDFDSECEDHIEIAWGAEAIGVELDSYDEWLFLLRKARRLEEEWRAEHGEHLFCRIRKDIFIEMRDDYGTLSPRDFLVLCGLYAVIGSKQYKQVSLNRIHYAANGCKSKLVFEKSGRNKKAAVTPKQVRSAIEKLHERSFFATVTYQLRYKYYSHRLSQPKLKKIVITHLKDVARDQSAKKKLSTISIHQVGGAQKKTPNVNSADIDDDVLDEEPPF